MQTINIKDLEQEYLYKLKGVTTQSEFMNVARKMSNKYVKTWSEYYEENKNSMIHICKSIDEMNESMNNVFSNINKTEIIDNQPILYKNSFYQVAHDKDCHLQLCYPIYKGYNSN